MRRSLRRKTCNAEDSCLVEIGVKGLQTHGKAIAAAHEDRKSKARWKPGIQRF